MLCEKRVKFHPKTGANSGILKQDYPLEHGRKGSLLCKGVT